MKNYSKIAPVLLTADNFTPLTRTPWAGSRILERYKPGLSPKSDRPRVGESWEISMGPELPSRCASTPQWINDVVSSDPATYLGAEARAGRSLSALLVKLLDAGDDLSVQIHPSDDYAGLSADEAGKPESWYVLQASPGAGVYLGLRPGVRPEHMRKRLASNEANVAELLNFIELSTGDFLLVEAGVPHAIGRGVTVLEPQHVAPGRRGVTYRYWDWNRRYDAAGKLDPSGEKRLLHIEDALAVTDWTLADDPEWLSTSMVRLGDPIPSANAQIQVLCGPEQSLLASPWLRVARISGTGTLTLPDWDVLQGLTVVGGSITFVDFELTVACGQSAVVPAALNSVRIHCDKVHALCCGVVV